MKKMFWRHGRFFKIFTQSNGYPSSKPTGEISYDILKEYPGSAELKQFQINHFYSWKKFHSEEEMKIWAVTQGIELEKVEDDEF